MTTTTDPAPPTDLIPADKKLTEIMTKPGELEAVLGQIEERVRSEAHAIDPGEKKGRDTLKSLAYKVARSKTALDDTGKEMGEELRKQLDAINSQRRLVKTRLDALQTETRKPAEDWEAQEKARVAEHERRFENLRTLARVPAEATSDEIRQSLETVEAIDPAKFEEFADVAAPLQREAREALTTALDAAIKREQEAEELARLRAEKEERERQEAEAESKARAEREAKERAEREEKIRQEAAERAAAEERARLEAEQKRKAEEEARRQEAERKAEEKRQANKRHREKVRREAVAAIEAAARDTAEAVDASTAAAIFDAIEAGQVPHVTVNY